MVRCTKCRAEAEGDVIQFCQSCGWVMLAVEPDVEKKKDRADRKAVIEEDKHGAVNG